MFLFIGDSKGQKYFTTNKFYTKIFNGDFFPNYGIYNVQLRSTPVIKVIM